jgi:hypothetical protein
MVDYGHYKLWVREGWKPNHYRFKTDAPWKNEGKFCRCCRELRHQHCMCNDWQLDGTRRVVFRKDPDDILVALFVDDTVWVHETKEDWETSLRRNHTYSGSLSVMHVPVILYFGAGHFPPTKHTTMNVHDSYLLRRAAPSEYQPYVKYSREALHIMKWWEVLVTDPGNSDFYCGWKELGWHRPFDRQPGLDSDTEAFNKAYARLPRIDQSTMWPGRNAK